MSCASSDGVREEVFVRTGPGTTVRHSYLAEHLHTVCHHTQEARDDANVSSQTCCETFQRRLSIPAMLCVAHTTGFLFSRCFDVFLFIFSALTNTRLWTRGSFRNS